MRDLTSADDLLYSLRRDNEEINDMISRLEELRALATSMTAPTDKEAVQTSGSGDKLVKLVAKIIDLENDINAEVDAYCERKEVVKEIAFKIKNESYQNMIYDYFLCNLPLWQIADDYEITYDNARQRLVRSKRIFEKIFEEDKKLKIPNIVFNQK